MSASGMHVGAVVGCCACSEMGRIAARWIVAVVKHQAIRWQRSVGSLKCDAMCSPLLTVFVSDDAVAVAVTRTCPGPALIWLAGDEVAGEAFSERHEAGAVTAGFRAERMALPADGAYVAMRADDVSEARWTDAATLPVKACVRWIQMAVSATFRSTHS